MELLEMVIVVLFCLFSFALGFSISLNRANYWKARCIESQTTEDALWRKIESDYEY